MGGVWGWMRGVAMAGVGRVWGSWDRNWVGAGFLAGRGVKGVPECRQDQRWTICLRLDYGRQFVVELRWVVGSEGGERDLIGDGAGRTFFLSAEGAERRGERRTAFFREVTRKGAKNTFCPRRNTEGRGERRAENGELLFSAKSREGARRTPLSTEEHGGARRTANASFW